MVSTGSGVRVVALGKAEAVRIGGTRLKKQNLVNATANTQDATVKVAMGKGFRFGSKARAAEAIVA